MHFLITAGATREYLDPVRFISNSSSGRMGLAVARAALARGHKVSLVVGPIRGRLPIASRIIQVETTNQMAQDCYRCFRNQNSRITLQRKEAGDREIESEKRKVVRIK